MRNNPYGIILKEEPKKQHLSTVPKSCSISIYEYQESASEISLT